MKRLPLILLLCLVSAAAAAQTVRPPDDFTTGQPVGDRRPMPFPFLRYDDIVWTTDHWRTIELAERFNHFMYYPDDPYINFGKKSLAYILWDAMAAGEIPIYEDDDLLVPLDNEAFVRRYTKPDTILLELGYDDENDTELYETVIRPKNFDGSEVRQYSLRMTWFIGKQDTRQDFRTIALAPIKETYRELPNGEDIYLGRLPIFWVPMQHPAVRALLARHTAYIDEGTIARQPSWDWVFLNQYYHAFTSRESNPYGRTLDSYLTGDNALLEAAIIEEEVFEIENGMWEH